MVSTDSSQEKIELEKAFELIAKGNDQEESNLWWDATVSFDRAREILVALSMCHPSPETPDEHQKIYALYQQQSIVYLHRARKTMIRAMTEENESDQNNTDSQPKNLLLYQKLSDDECLERMSLFGRLFAKEISELPQQQIALPIEEQESSLEGRLRDLNSSLPKGLKSEEERMREINRGLGRLGLSLYSASDERNKPFGGVFAIEPPKSESDQIADVIAQVKDEIAVMGPSLGEETTTATEADGSNSAVRKFVLSSMDSQIVNSDEDESDIENEFDHDDDEKELTADDCKEMQLKLADAQATLSELIAMFDVDSGGDAPIQFDQGSGKLALKKARIILLQVTKKWNEIE
jgi:hypothetical protein